MSPNVGNFVHDLVEMAKAMETLPGVQAQLAEAHNDIQSYLATIQRLELKLVDRANEIDTLYVDVRKAEEARDEATQAFLEADDRTEKALAFVRTVMGNAQGLLAAVEPAKALPEPVQEPTPVQPEGKYWTAENERAQSVTDPTVLGKPGETGNVASSSGVSSTENVSPLRTINISESGESVANPTAPSPATPLPWPASAATDAAATTADAPDGMADKFDPGPAIGHGWNSPSEWKDPYPYAGKRWSDVTPRVYSFSDWTTGGGTAEAFNL